MAIGIKVCKVCGREYEACRTLRPNLNNEFRWQDVACCPEHGAEYLRRVMAARGAAAPQEKEPEPPKRNVRRNARKRDEE